MYDNYFDGRADDLDADETIERAYALGVASVCGDPSDEEYERLKEASPDAYDETIIELAFDEGRAMAMDLEAEDEAAGRIWETLVEHEFTRSGANPSGGDVPTGLPESLAGWDADRRTEDLPSSLEFPSFLKK